jgi:hypothetical protein
MLGVKISTPHTSCCDIYFLQYFPLKKDFEFFKLYLQYYLGFVTDLQGRGVEIIESLRDWNISTPLSCQSVTDSK